MRLRLHIALRLPSAAETAGICCSVGLLSFLTSMALNSKPAAPVVTPIASFVPQALTPPVSPLAVPRKPHLKRGSNSCTSLTETEIASIIDRNALAHGVNRSLLDAIIDVESAGDPCAVSHAGAAGLMQLTPETARHYGVRNVFDPNESVSAGTRHLQYLLKRYDSNLTLALAAYNAGTGNVDRSNGVPPFTETQHYVKKVLTRLFPAH